VIDVVTRDSIRCNCFTKSYSQYAKGTGSLLATVSREEMDPAWSLVEGAHLVHETLDGVRAIGGRSRGADEKGEGNNSSSSNSRGAAKGSANGGRLEGRESQGTSATAAVAPAVAVAAAPAVAAAGAAIAADSGLSGGDVGNEPGLERGSSSSKVNWGDAVDPQSDELTALQQRLELAAEMKKLQLRYFTPRWVRVGTSGDGGGCEGECWGLFGWVQLKLQIGWVGVGDLFLYV
jgi:hypothetical protein